MEIFSWIYSNLIYRPQLNLLEWFYHVTGDVGWSIIFLALVVNLLLWPMFGKSYVNTQKMRLLQPQIKEIQDKFKNNPQELMTQIREFYQKHKIKTSTTFIILIFQIFFATGLYNLTTSLSHGQELTGLYTFLFNTDRAQFGHIAFGFINISDIATNYIWLPFLAAGFSYLTGMYMFRWSPKPKFPEIKKSKPKPKKDEPVSPFDPEAFQKSLEFQSIYFFPLIIFFSNYFLTTGVAVYFATVNVMALARQIFLVNFYKNHIDKLIEDIVSSDPSFYDKNPDNNLNSNIDPQNQIAQPVATKQVKPKTKSPVTNKSKIPSKSNKSKKQQKLK